MAGQGKKTDVRNKVGLQHRKKKGRGGSAGNIPVAAAGPPQYTEAQNTTRLIEKLSHEQPATWRPNVQSHRLVGSRALQAKLGIQQEQKMGHREGG